VDLRLVRAGGERLWSADGLGEDEAYTVADDRTATEENRRQALETLSRRLAEKIINRITADF
jgi:hypothetical protein